MPASPDLTRRLIRYWRTSLADEMRREPTTAAHYVSRESVQAGTLPGDVVRSLLRPHVPLRGGNAGGDAMSPPTSRTVVLCLARAIPRRDHGQSRSSSGRSLQGHPLICIPARVDARGQLTPDDGALPWIPRRSLEPTASEREPTVASVADLDRFLERHAHSGESWDLLWTCADDLLALILDGQPFDERLPHHLIALDPVSIHTHDDAVGANTAILALYDAIDTHPIAPLMERFANLSDTASREFCPVTISEDLHLGQMDDEFPLSPSQRTALASILDMGEGELLAVNGPPGTGKTTLLQALIASLWIRAALDDDLYPHPPIVVATSANNQAVTNVIRSFAQADGADSALAGRWIPRVHSHGLFCAADSREDRDQYQFVDPRFEKGFFAQLETPSAIESARDHFLKRCRDWADHPIPRVRDGVRRLRESLRDTVRTIETGLAARRGVEIEEPQILAMYGTSDALRHTRDRTRTEADELRRALESVERVLQEALLHVRGRPVWHSWLLWFPLVRRIRQRQDRVFRDVHGLPEQLDLRTRATVQEYFSLRIPPMRRGYEEGQERLRELDDACERLDRIRRDWAAWRRVHAPSRTDESAVKHLDTCLRHRAFLLATHYWEGRWLLEVDVDPARRLPDTRGLQPHLRRLRRYAKLTPCFVSTLFKFPDFFGVWKGGTQRIPEPIVDVLILDEAGQVAPHVAGAAFALAKRAVVVGDEQQIQPVALLPEPVDCGNLKHAAVASTSAQQSRILKQTGLAASTGSALRVAQRASRHFMNQNFPGMFLVEHWRCARSIIEYSNQLAYSGQLQPMREDPVDPALPLWGYANVQGSCEREGKSRINPWEAETIARWISERSHDLEIQYERPLNEVVAVLTPFAAQARRLRAALSGQSVEGLTVGTVHSLQGAERPVVIFSPVYNRSDDTRYFFDRGVHLLNVAVSRARESFLVFGDMAVFDPRAGSPSGLLARFLFSHPDNALTDVPPVPDIGCIQQRHPHSAVTALRGTEAHQTALRDALRQAQSQLWISSPVLSSNALHADDLLPEMRCAASRGVDVTVYYSADLNRDPRTQAEREVASLAREQLAAAGVKVRLGTRFHNKTLAVDDHTLIEGSFNWLAAVRDRESPFRRYERSFLSRGSLAGEIKAARNDMEAIVRVFESQSDSAPL